MPSAPQISLLIPVYNSGHLAAETTRQLLDALSGVSEKEVIFANDGSTDDSLRYLESLSRTCNKVRIMSHPNQGLGYTLNRLIREATSEICAYLDMDLSFNVRYLPSLIQAIEAYDIVLASKYVGKAECCLPLVRRISSRLYYLASRLFFGVKVKDIGSGMVVFRRNRVLELDLACQGFDWHLELYHKAKRSGYRIREYPTPYVHYESGTFSIRKHALHIVGQFIGYTLKSTCAYLDLSRSTGSGALMSPKLGPSRSERMLP